MCYTKLAACLSVFQRKSYTVSYRMPIVEPVHFGHTRARTAPRPMRTMRLQVQGHSCVEQEGGRPGGASVSCGCCNARNIMVVQ